MTDQLVLRRALARDAQLLLSIRYLAYLPVYAKYSYAFDPCLDGIEVFQGSLKEDEHYALYYRQRIIGGAKLKTTNNDVELLELYIDPAYQHQGFGTTALHLLESVYPSAYYRVILPGNALSGLFHNAGYRPLEAGTPSNTRLTRYLWVKETWRQTQILLNPLKREQLRTVFDWTQELTPREMYEWSAGSLVQAPTLEQLGNIYAAGKHYAGARRMDFAIEIPMYNAIIGVLSLANIDWDVRRAQVVNMIIDKRWRSVGLGRRTVDSICMMAFQKYGIRGITAALLEDTNAMRSFEAAGFVEAYRKDKAFELSSDTMLDRVIMVRRAYLNEAMPSEAEEAAVNAALGQEQSAQ